MNIFKIIKLASPHHYDLKNSIFKLFDEIASLRKYNIG